MSLTLRCSFGFFRIQPGTLLLSNYHSTDRLRIEEKIKAEAEIDAYEEGHLFDQQADF